MGGPIPPKNGGTGSHYFGFSGATTLRTYTFPDANVTLVPTTGTGATGTWNISITGTSSGAPPTGPASGDLSSNYPSPTVSKINGVSLGATTASSGNVLIGSGTQWVSNSISGDITINSTGVTAIGSGKVTNSMIANGTIDLTTKVTGILPNSNTTATSSSTNSSIVSRDGSGNFSAGTITASLNGNASTVTTNANLTGDVKSVGNATTISTVNSNVGSFGDSTHVGAFTVNAKGQVTAASSVLITGASPTGSAGGDLSGTYPNPSVVQINGVSLGTTTATSGNLLIGSGTSWVTNPMSGDITINSTGVTAIGSNKVTNAMIRQSAALSVIGNSTNATANVADISAGSDFQVLRRSGTAVGFGSVNLASSNAVTGLLSGTNGGTNANNGSSQIIISGNVVFTGAFTFSGALTGNTNITFPTTGTLATTANTVASITGTANQVIASASTGAVTLSLPQSIATTSTPTFSTLTLSQSSLFNSALMLNNTSASSYKNQVVFQNSGVNKYALIVDFTQAQDNNIAFYDYVAGASRLSIDNTGKVLVQTNIASSSTTTGSLTTAGGLGVGGAINTGSSVTINTGDAIVNTAGRTVKIKSGTNACFGTGAVMVAGTVTVSTTAVATGDIVLVMKTAAGGTSTNGMPTITINNGVSFTITGTSLDTSTWSWVIIKAA